MKVLFKAFKQSKIVARVRVLLPVTGHVFDFEASWMMCQHFVVTKTAVEQLRQASGADLTCVTVNANFPLGGITRDWSFLFDWLFTREQKQLASHTLRMMKQHCVDFWSLAVLSVKEVRRDENQTGGTAEFTQLIKLDRTRLPLPSAPKESDENSPRWTSPWGNKLCGDESTAFVARSCHWIWKLVYVGAAAPSLQEHASRFGSQHEPTQLPVRPGKMKVWLELQSAGATRASTWWRICCGGDFVTEWVSSKAVQAETAVMRAELMAGFETSVLGHCWFQNPDHYLGKASL